MLRHAVGSIVGTAVMLITLCARFTLMAANLMACVALASRKVVTTPDRQKAVSICSIF